METKRFYEVFREMSVDELNLVILEICRRLYGPDWEITIFTFMLDFSTLADEFLLNVIKEIKDGYPKCQAITCDDITRGTSIFEKYSDHPDDFSSFVSKFLVCRYGHDQGRSKTHLEIIRDFMTASNDYLETVDKTTRLGVFKAMGDFEINKSLLKIERLSNGVGYRTR